MDFLRQCRSTFRSRLPLCAVGAFSDVTFEDCCKWINGELRYSQGYNVASVDTTACVTGSSAEQPLSEQQRAEAEAASTAAEALEHAQLRAQLEEATLPLMLDAMWAANVLDIESTLRHVCKKVGPCIISVRAREFCT